MNEIIESSNLNDNKDEIKMMPIRYIDDFPNHPFKVRDDDEMEMLMESISIYGISSPVLVRVKENGRYELISGHRRKFACEKLGIDYIPVIVRTLSNEEAAIAMVDSNLQREHILPSEKAYAYKIKYEALKRTAGRPKNNKAPLVDNYLGVKSTEILGRENSESGEQIRRYIRLTKLIPEILEMVDEDRISFRPAVELSYLAEAEQYDLLETIKSEDCTPSLAQSIRMKKLSQEGKLDMDSIFHIMTEEKGNQKQVYKIAGDKIERFFSWETTPKEIEDTIIKALEFYRKWERHNDRCQEVR